MNTPLLDSLLSGKIDDSEDSLWFLAIRESVRGFEEANKYEHGNTAVSETQGARSILEGVLQIIGHGNGYFRCSECGAFWDCAKNVCPNEESHCE